MFYAETRSQSKGPRFDLQKLDGANTRLPGAWPKSKSKFLAKFSLRLVLQIA